MITNHGVHEWRITAGLPDTGGQNVYVNDLSATLVALGYRVSVYNRGGYPHPVTGTMRTGEHYRDPYERIVYVTDGQAEFLRKEEMKPRVAALGAEVARHLAADGIPVTAFLSHYWDGAMVAEAARGELAEKAPHVWIPHSLGELKKSGTGAEEWEELRLDERIAAERELLRQVDGVACTSKAMQHTLIEDYGRRDCVFLPPCVDTSRFDREAVEQDRRAAAVLAEASGRSEAEILRRRIVTEVSRTDRTKRKDLLIRAFAEVHGERPDTLLAVTIDRSKEDLAAELLTLIEELGLSDSVAVLGSVWDTVPSLYGMTAVYCTPSIMEGFGMSVQEAAACGVPAVASTRVPFAVEFLRGDGPGRRQCSTGEEAYEVGEGAVIVPPDDAGCLAAALSLLLDDEALRRELGEAAYRITIPRFTWKTATVRFLRESGIPGPPAADTARGEAER